MVRFSKIYRYNILCEDRQTDSFIRNILIHQNVDRHKIRSYIAASGRGSGEAFVKREYEGKLEALRRFKRENIVLIVCSDADSSTVLKKKEYIEKCSEVPRKDDEAVIIWIPKRSIENWIHYLREDGDSIIEDMRFIHTGSPMACTEEANKMSDYLQGSDMVVLPSMEDAKYEFIRLCNIQIKRSDE